MWQLLILGGLSCGKISIYSRVLSASSSPCWKEHLHPLGKMEWNPLENVPKCDRCAMCRANKFMIEQIRETIKDHKFEAKSENSFVKRQLEDQRKQIAALKHKCKHMDETINYLKSLLIN